MGHFGNEIVSACPRLRARLQSQCVQLHRSCRFPIVLSLRSRFLRAAAAFVMACLLAVASARAAEPPPFTAAELDQMLASIALFPDALLSQVLMASTYPSDVALAVDWAYAHRKLEGDAAVQAVQDKPWDPSVQSLVAFPQVLAMLGENPQWVRDLGDAFLAQPGDVMDSVQFLRAKAKDAGNLASNEQQVVAVEPAPPPPQIIVVNAPPPPTQIITIVPANPQVVFVPIYNPVWAFGPWWHPGFPPFFFPPPPRWGWGWSSAPSTPASGGAWASACRTRCGAASTGAGATSTSTSTAGTTSTSITGSIRATAT